ncbi:MAG: DUF2088 domain-containing protein [Deltaproteobacteria bacterium]|nr:DUF2088 domain-containing protein [Deltaproteobacteria bacterium]
MQVTMSYGLQGLILALPDDWQVDVINKKAMPVMNDPRKAVAEALNSPVNCRPLKEEAQDKKSACILICDITRPLTNGKPRSNSNPCVKARFDSSLRDLHPKRRD